MYRTAFVFLFFVALLTSNALAQAERDIWFDDERLSKIDAFILDKMQRTRTVGLALVLVEDGKIIKVRGFGQREKGGPDVDSSTVFAIGSISKSFTGNVAAQLIAEGLVDADAPISEYLPSWDGNRPHHQSITLRRALNHQTGYSQTFGNVGARARDVSNNALAEFTAGLSNKSPQTQPATAFEYSNANYKIAGRAIEVASGETFEELVNSRIFDVAGMTGASVNNPAVENQATPHIYWGHNPTATDFHAGSAVDPAANVYASATDMGAYLIALMKPKDAPGSLWDPILADTSFKGLDDRSYSFGWEQEKRGEMTILHHSGLNPGYSAMAGFSHDGKIGFSILNAGGQGMIAGDNFGLNNGVFDLVFGNPPRAGTNFTANAVTVTVCVAATLALIGWLVWLARQVLLNKLTREHAPKATFRPGPLAVNLALVGLAAVAIYIIPNAVNAPLSTIWLYNPDAALVLSALGGTALSAVFVRQALFIADRWLNKYGS